MGLSMFSDVRTAWHPRVREASAHCMGARQSFSSLFRSFVSGPSVVYRHNAAALHSRS